MGSRTKWSTQEEQFVKKCRQVQKMESWKEISQKINKFFNTNDKTGKQCRQRYVNYIRLNKNNEQSQWTEDDDQNFSKYFLENSFKWASIVKNIPNKSENELKNRFYGGMRKMTKAINNIEKKHRIRKTKPIRYESLIRVLEYSSKGSIRDKIAEQNFVQFHKKLKETLLQQSWRNINNRASQEKIKEIIEGIHQFNSLTLFFGKNQDSEKPSFNIEQKKQGESQEILLRNSDRKNFEVQKDNQMTENKKSVQLMDLPDYQANNRESSDEYEDLDLLLSRILNSEYQNHQFSYFQEM